MEENTGGPVSKAECRKCGACCVAISISSPILGMTGGKPAGVACIHLTRNDLCELFESPDRPEVCALFKPSPDTCGDSREEALALLAKMESDTVPD